MILTIDNLAGAGAVDYSAVLCADHPLKIERVLNATSRCSGMLVAGSPANPGAGAGAARARAPRARRGRGQ
jgi:hypothetical protein